MSQRTVILTIACWFKHWCIWIQPYLSMHIGMLDLNFGNGSRTWRYSKLLDLCLVCSDNRIETIFFWLLCMLTPLSSLQSNPWVNFYSSRNVITFIGHLYIQENALNLIVWPHGQDTWAEKRESQDTWPRSYRQSLNKPIYKGNLTPNKPKLLTSY